MITRKNEVQTLVEFGYGDICISGVFNEMCEGSEGCLVILNQEPQEIGTLSARGGQPFYPGEELHVKMTFKKTSSIDVLIRQLELTKAEMMERGLT